MQKFDTIVVGGGPAGMMAAYAAKKGGGRVALLERNSQLGKKLLITGKGRCNITNNADVEDFIAAVPVNPSFLYSAFYSFTNTDLLDRLHRYGLQTKVERGGRVFPVSDRSMDVLEALRKMISDVSIQTGCRVERLLLEDGKVGGVQLYDGRNFKADRVILATGGMSYPATGSTGDGYRMAQEAGHTIVPPKASLVPLVTVEKWPEEVMGLSLKNVSLRVLDKKGREVYSDFGEMLFTHFGVSGPIVLSASSHIRAVDGHSLQIDLKPALSEKQLNDRLVRDFDKYSRKDFAHALDDLLPKKLIPVIVRLSGIDSQKKVHQVTRQERQGLVELLQALPLTVKAMRPVSEAIITSGGVKVGEINPSTMESKIVPGLYFCGEMIDVDAYTGGFNLQIAFSTGFLGGKG